MSLSVYSRSRVIADHILVDATTGDLAEISGQHFPGIQVAMTAAVSSSIGKAAAHPDHSNDREGVWHDVLASASPPLDKKEWEHFE